MSHRQLQRPLRLLLVIAFALFLGACGNEEIPTTSQADDFGPLIDDAPAAQSTADEAETSNAPDSLADADENTDAIAAEDAMVEVPADDELPIEEFEVVDGLPSDDERIIETLTSLGIPEDEASAATGCINEQSSAAGVEFNIFAGGVTILMRCSPDAVRSLFASTGGYEGSGFDEGQENCVFEAAMALVQSVPIEESIAAESNPPSEWIESIAGECGVPSDQVAAALAS